MHAVATQHKAELRMLRSNLGIEKVIAGNSDAMIRVKPLTAGTYIFYGEYHEDTAKGHIVVE